MRPIVFMNFRAEHLSNGTLAALAQSELALQKYPEAEEHLKNCKACRENYQKFKYYLENRSKLDFASLAHSVTCAKCTEASAEFAQNTMFFFAFLTKELPEEVSVRLISHLNNCYYCLEAFSVNWSDYLSVKV